MKFQPNDAYDLSNLVYVAPNDKYWTKEVRWQRIIKDIAGLGHYLVEYREENYFPKNEPEQEDVKKSTDFTTIWKTAITYIRRLLRLP